MNRLYVIVPSPLLLLRSLMLSVLLSSWTTTRALAFCPVVICPGFGNDAVDYDTPLEQSREVGLVSALERRGFDPDRIFVVPVKRADWLRVAGGVLDVPDFYTNTARPTGRGYGWYVRRVKETVDEAAADGDRVLVLGHSAGGWLARAAMGDGTWNDDVRTADRIRALVTVGAIHRPPGLDPKSCVTRGALAYTDANYPGALLADEGVGYVSVGGDAIQGDATKYSTQDDVKGEEGEDADRLYSKRGEGSAARVAFTSYGAVCGQGDVTGDGVVPLEWTQLEGAKQIRLDGVIHSINEAGTTIATDRWYGSEDVIDRWLPTAMEEAGLSNKKQQSKGGNPFDFGKLQEWASQVFPPK